ncbi:MAG: porin family protein [Sulfurospirillaceae bacterium]|nr:porin family protein [Sulfurospirillaceae bacterium]
MVKKLSIVGVLVLCVGMSVYAKDFYVKIGAGMANVSEKSAYNYNVDFSNAKLYTAAIGKNFGNFAVEAEYSHESCDWNNKSLNLSGKGTTNGYMINGYYNFPLNSKFAPYIGAGIGHTNFTDGGYTSSGTTAYQGILGVSYPINNNFNLNAEYRYKYASYKSVDLTSNNLLVGLTIKF